MFAVSVAIVGAWWITWIMRPCIREPQSLILMLALCLTVIVTTGCVFCNIKEYGVILSKDYLYGNVWDALPLKEFERCDPWFLSIFGILSLFILDESDKEIICVQEGSSIVCAYQMKGVGYILQFAYRSTGGKLFTPWPICWH